jgi:hypothetical protein
MRDPPVIHSKVMSLPTPVLQLPVNSFTTILPGAIPVQVAAETASPHYNLHKSPSALLDDNLPQIEEKAHPNADGTIFPGMEVDIHGTKVKFGNDHHITVLYPSALGIATQVINIPDWSRPLPTAFITVGDVAFYPHYVGQAVQLITKSIQPNLIGAERQRSKTENAQSEVTALSDSLSKESSLRAKHETADNISQLHNDDAGENAIPKIPKKPTKNASPITSVCTSMLLVPLFITSQMI